jgi:ABC-type dipeptide/oligopeptide/nickel transport system ATPase component
MEEIWGKDELNKGRIYQGVIAQELQKVAPDMVREVSVIKDGENEEQTTESFLEVDPNKFTYALINAVQEQQEQIEQQQNEIQELKEANASLNESIYEIKAHLNLQTKKE